MTRSAPADTVYIHRQIAPLHLLLLADALLLLAGGVVVPEPVAALSLTGGGLLLVLLSWTFRWLEVRVTAAAVEVRFGPLPLFGTRVRLADLCRAEPVRTTWLDGWGVHWTPGRGWLYNLWGVAAVQLALRDGRRLRIGTDDPAGLLAALRRHLATAGQAQAGSDAAVPEA